LLRIDVTVEQVKRLVFNDDKKPFTTPTHFNRMCIIINNYTHRTMRTNIVIDETLMRDVLQATGLQTKREAVERGLQLLLRLTRQARIREFRGKLHWEGNLDEIRVDKA
jgi:Arc/MetJ family transcription regulator